MKFDFQYRPSDSPLVEFIYRTESEGGGSFISTAGTNWEMVVTRQIGRISITVRGPETQARPAPVPEYGDFLGIVFKHGVFMPHLPVKDLVNNGTNLPLASGQAFWLQGAAWEFPNFENVDTFINRLVRDNLLTRDEVVEAVLQNERPGLSPRSIERHFVQATGLTQGTLFQIQRAQQAAALLGQGVPILDVVEQAGYFDQPHLTRQLKRYYGQTPAQLLRTNAAE